MTIVVGTTRTLEILKSPVVLSKAKMSHGVCGHTMQVAKFQATPDPILGVEAVGDQRLWHNAEPEHHSFSLVNSEDLMSYCPLTRLPLNPCQGPGGLKQKLTLQRLGHLIVLLTSGVTYPRF